MARVPDSPELSVAAICRLTEKTYPTVRKALRHARLEPRKHGRELLFPASAALEAVLWPKRASGQPKRAAAGQGDLGKLLAGIALPQEHLLPWLHGDVVRFDEYAESIGFTCDELFELAIYGFPLLPPLEGDKVARVSVPHAERWRLMFAGMIEELGGDGQALHLEQEARKIRGLALDSAEPEE